MCGFPFEVVGFCASGVWVRDRRWCSVVFLVPFAAVGSGVVDGASFSDGNADRVESVEE